MAPGAALPLLRRDADGPNGRVATADRPLNAASPWMALRYNGDGPNFRLEELSCPSCATLMCVREVRRNGKTEQ